MQQHKQPGERRDGQHQKHGAGDRVAAERIGHHQKAAEPTSARQTDEKNILHENLCATPKSVQLSCGLKMPCASASLAFCFHFMIWSLQTPPRARRFLLVVNHFLAGLVPVSGSNPS